MPGSAVTRPVWKVLRDAWAPYLGDLAEERARNVAQLLMDDEPRTEAAMVAMFTRKMTVLNHPPYGIAMNGEAVADAVTAGIEAMAEAYA